MVFTPSYRLRRLAARAVARRRAFYAFLRNAPHARRHRWYRRRGYYYRRLVRGRRIRTRYMRY